jgi:hypothetical protein
MALDEEELVEAEERVAEGDVPKCPARGKLVGACLPLVEAPRQSRETAVGDSELAHLVEKPMAPLGELAHFSLSLRERGRASSSLSPWERAHAGPLSLRERVGVRDLG